MVIKNLKAGEYTVIFTNDGYETLSAEINVSSAGVTCISGPCGSAIAPGVQVSGLWAVFGILKPIAAPPPPAKGYLSVSSTPSGAHIDVNGTAIGRTPISRYELTTGSKLVTLRLSGYMPAERSATIVAGQTAELIVPLTLIPVAEEAYLSVISTPSGATVSVDDVAIGTTPFTDYVLPAGPGVVSVSSGGYQTGTQEFTIDPGETSTVDITLEEAVVPTTIGGWIDSVGVGSLTREHWLYAYYLSIGATDLADINYPNLVPKPSPMAAALATRENWLALYYYSIGATDLGNLNTGCNY